MKPVLLRLWILGLWGLAACTTRPTEVSKNKPPVPTALPTITVWLTSVVSVATNTAFVPVSPYPVLPVEATSSIGYVPPPPPPTITPGPSPTPWPTTTPIPTNTPRPTDIPTIVPPVQTVTAKRLPPITHDVLFIENYALKLWNHGTRKIETIISPGATIRLASYTLGDAPPPPEGGVRNYWLTGERQGVALLWRVEGMELVRFALDTSAQDTLARLPPNASLFPQLSPDGQWVAYPVSHAHSQTEIYAMRLDGSEPPLQVALCEETTTAAGLGCTGFLWSLDSRSIAVGDGQGLRSVGLDGSSQRWLSIDGGKGHIYTPSEWSPKGRYLMVWIARYASEGAWRGVLDTETYQLQEFSYIYNFGGHSSQAIWLFNGDLLVTRPGSGHGGVSPFYELWKPSNLHDAVMQQELTDYLAGDFMDFPADPVQFLNGDIAVAMMNSDPMNYRTRGLYVSQVDPIAFRQVTGMPPVSPYDWENNLFWAKDGSGALLRDSAAARLWYIPTDGSAIYDMSGVISHTTCCFTWLP